MLSSGDVVRIDLGIPAGSEAGLTRSAVVVTAQRVLTSRPRVLHVVPLTTTLRAYSSEVILTADETNGLDHDSAAQCQHVRSVAAARISDVIGNVGALALTQIRDTLAVLLDL